MAYSYSGRNFFEPFDQNKCLNMHLDVTLTFLLHLQFPVTLQVKWENLRLTLKVILGQFVRKALSLSLIKLLSINSI